MNTVFRSLILLFLLSSSLFGQIIESKKMADILKTVTADSVVVFDLDNTIMEAAQSVGSDQWFEHRLSYYKASGLPIQQAVEVTSKEWEAVNYAGKVKLVEEETPALIELLQDSGIPTMGLTARPATFIDESLSQLRGLAVEFTRYTISNELITIKEKDTATFKDGLMSVGGNNKGTILLALMKQVGFNPGRVIFVDDKVKNVTNVDNALNAVLIPSFAYRYGAADQKVKDFDAKLADFEFSYFQNYGVVLSDSQAKKIMP